MGAGRGNLSSRAAPTTRVLVIEDEPDIADFLRAFFRASGYDLVHVDPTSARHAVTRVREDHPDCVLLDVRLRTFSGLDAYRMLRDDPTFDLVPVILVTADAAAPRRAVGVAGGLDGFVRKPFSVKALERMVAERVERARRLGAGGDSGGRDAGGVAAEGFVQVRLEDEVAAATAIGAEVSFALVRLRHAAAIRRDVGPHGVDFACRSVAEHLVAALPSGAVVGRAGSGEVAVILPGLSLEQAERALGRALRGLPPVAEMPGGAVVALPVWAGLAAAPRHAVTPDQLYMATDAALADAGDRGVALAVAR